MMKRWLDAFARRLRPRPGPPERPVLVGGSPKSGTTAIAMLLGVATETEVASDPFHRLDERGLDFRDRLYTGRLSIARLIDDNPDVFAAGIIKDPNFAFFVGPLLERFPHSHVVLIVRDPRANIRSILNRLGIRGDARQETVDAKLRELPEAWRRVLTGRTPDVAGSDFIERMAHRWNAAVDGYRSYVDRVRLVTYEDFNRDKERVISTLAADVGLEVKRPLGTAADRQYQPRGDRGVDWVEFFGERNLAAIDRICADRMRPFGYEPRAI